jgi:hypothetical protein
LFDTILEENRVTKEPSGLPADSDTKATFYTWNPPASPAEVQLDFSVIDGLLLEVMKGFGAVPKRGAEVGGILLGSVSESSGHRTIHISGFRAVACAHAFGPSFLLTADEKAALSEAIENASADGESPVGFFRSHTRDGLQLCPDDLALLSEHFPGREPIVLLIKPYATRLSQAGFFLPQDGAYPEGPSLLEFPFRRKELGGGSSPVERHATAARFGQASPAEDVNPYLDPRPQAPAALEQDQPPAFTTMDAPKSKGIRSGWVWIPLSFIFMLLGTVLGFQIALSMRPKQPANPYLEAWSLSLSVRKSGPELQVYWDPLAPAIRNASRGVLHMDSKEETRAIDLNASQLRAGSLIYRSVPERVLLRLEVFPRERGSVSEAIEFKAGN